MNQRSDPIFSSKCPARGGAYILEMNVQDGVSLRVGRLGHLDFHPGRYLYVGSAYGPGGIEARVTRHLGSKSRRPHWHVDYLSAVVGVRRGWGVAGGMECEIVSALLRDRRASIPFAGFGSSDCSQCSAHLLYAPKRMSLRKAISSEGEVFGFRADAKR